MSPPRPGTAPRRKKRADAVRNVDEMLNATVRTLARGTVPSISAVAAEAGVSRVTLYNHFPTLEALIDAVVDRAMEQTDSVLAGLDLDDEPPLSALGHVVAAVWPILDDLRAIRTVATAQLGPTVLRDRHDRVLAHVDAIIARGQAEGDIRTDFSRDWLVATFYAIVHAAADEVSAGRLEATDAIAVLTRTVTSALRPDET